MTCNNEQVFATHSTQCAPRHSRLRVRLSATDTDISSIEGELEAAKAELAAAKQEHRLLERKKEEAYRYTQYIYTQFKLYVALYNVQCST
jgi:hypothetical protein